MAKVIFVVGEFSTGKSFSCRNMPPDKTLFINVNKTKDLPFKGYKKKFTSFSISNNTGNFAEPTNPKSIQHMITFPERLLPNFDKLGLTQTNILNRFDYVIIDDIGYTMTKEFMDTAKVKSYDKFTDMAYNLYSIVKAAEASPVKYVVLIFHTDLEYNGGVVIGEKIKTVGKLVDNNVRLEGLPTIILRSTVSYTETGEPQYTFITNKREGILARSPHGMYESEIDNDLYEALLTADKYYAD